MSTVFIPVFFLAVVFAIVAQDIFGGRLKRCICLDDWEETAGGGVSQLPVNALGGVDRNYCWPGSDDELNATSNVTAIRTKEDCELLAENGYNYIWANQLDAGHFDSVGILTAWAL